MNTKTEESKVKAMARNIKNTLFIIFALLIMLGSWAYLYIINTGEAQASYRAKAGVMDLRHWDTKQNLDLDGEWEFYPGVLIDPQKDDFDHYKAIRKIVDLPGPWNEYLNQDKSPEGSGTYRLKILLPEEGVYAIKTNTIRNASRIFADQQYIAGMGKVSEGKSNWIAESRYTMGSFSSQKELELTAQISNYDYQVGGITRSILFGRFDKILEADRSARALDGFIVLTSLVLSAYFFLNYLQRKESLYIGYFSGASFFIGLYLSTMDEQLLRLLFDYTYPTRMRIQLAAMIMMSLCVLRFTHCFFKEYGNKKIVDMISAILILGLPFVFITSLAISYKYAGIVEKTIGNIILISFLYIYIILLKAIRVKSDSFGYVLLIATALGIYWVAMFAKILFEITLGQIPLLSILLLLISSAMLMSHRLNLDYVKANALSDTLIEYDAERNMFVEWIINELKSPLNTILTLSGSLAEGKKGNLNPKQQEALISTYQETKRLEIIVEEFLQEQYRQALEHNSQALEYNQEDQKNEKIQEAKPEGDKFEEAKSKEAKLEQEKSQEEKHQEAASGENLSDRGLSDRSLSKTQSHETKPSAILLYTKDPSTLRVMNKTTQELGHNIFIADTIEEATSILEVIRIDLVILDFAQEENAGESICQKIRTRYNITQMPILALGKTEKSTEMTKTFRCGANDYVCRAADKDELKNRISSLLRMKKAVEEGLEREFQYFYSQISPHFLYNTLNTIIGLCQIDQDKATEALLNLSIYFRGKLEPHKSKALIPLEEELELVKSYLEIEKLRFGDKLEIEYDLQENLMGLIPPLTIQPLVENAVKHGIMGKEGGGKLKLLTKKEAGKISIIIEDNGKGIPEEQQEDLLKSTRIGFKNVYQKIQELEGADFKLESVQGKGTKIEIMIPEDKRCEQYL